MTPLQQQYQRTKKQFPDTIVFFRLGDFYESFDEDAKKVAEARNIILTARDMGTGQRVPLAGVPYQRAIPTPRASSPPGKRYILWSRLGLLEKPKDFQGVFWKFAR